MIPVESNDKVSPASNLGDLPGPDENREGRKDGLASDLKCVIAFAATSHQCVAPEPPMSPVARLSECWVVMCMRSPRCLTISLVGP